jgi:hypothetical protein
MFVFAFQKRLSKEKGVYWKIQHQGLSVNDTALFQGERSVLAVNDTALFQGERSVLAVISHIPCVEIDDGNDI